MSTNSDGLPFADAVRMLAIVEAAYAVEASNHDWTSGMLAAVVGAIGETAGGFACAFGRDDGDDILFSPDPVSWLNVPWGRVLQRLEALSANPPSWMGEQRDGEARATLSVDGNRTSMEVIAWDGSGSGLLFSLDVFQPRDAAVRIRRVVTRMAAHILAALRLRGRLDDASGTRKVRPTCSGCMVGRKSEPLSVAGTNLTKTERAVVSALARGSSTKEVAHCLGLSDSTVRVLLMRAVRRSGASSRQELVQVWQRTQASRPPR
jgi:DNA-binding CsgD family transcriptional regulator